MDAWRTRDRERKIVQKYAIWPAKKTRSYYSHLVRLQVAIFKRDVVLQYMPIDARR